MHTKEKTELIRFHEINLFARFVSCTILFQFDEHAWSDKDIQGCCSLLHTFLIRYLFHQGNNPGDTADNKQRMRGGSYNAFNLS